MTVTQNEPTLAELARAAVARIKTASMPEPTLTGRLQDGESMPDLTDEIKGFIVRGLARFDTPSQVAAAVNVNFGITVCRQQVYRYDPDCSQPPAQRWRELHAATRAKFLAEVAGIGLAHKAVRLRLLDQMAHCSLANRQFERVAAFMEQAAKECGGAYESRKARLPIDAVPQVDVSPKDPATSATPTP